MLYMTTLRVVNGERIEIEKLLPVDHKSCHHTACVASGDCFTVRTSVLFDDSSGYRCSSACSARTMFSDHERLHSKSIHFLQIDFPDQNEACISCYGQKNIPPDVLKH